MGVSLYTLLWGDCTLCIEILNTEYFLWNKTIISVDELTSAGIRNPTFSVKKFRYNYKDEKNHPKIIYFHRLIVNFYKSASSPRNFLHILVNIPLSLLNSYPSKFTGTYIIAYGIQGRATDVDADKVYDYHTAFDIKPTEVSYNVDINANQKAIRNIKLEKNSNGNGVATVGYVKEIIPFTKNSLYREYFQEVYDFSDARNYNLNVGVSGIVFTGINPILTLRSVKDLSIVDTDGIRLQNNYFDLAVSNHPNYTICVVMKLWMNRNFYFYFLVSSKVLSFNKVTKELSLITTAGTEKFTIPSLFNGKKMVLCLTENSGANVIKASLSNYASTLTKNAITFNPRKYKFRLETEDGMFHKLMFSSNFYDFE